METSRPRSSTARILLVGYVSMNINEVHAPRTLIHIYIHSYIHSYLNKYIQVFPNFYHSHTFSSADGSITMDLVLIDTGKCYQWLCLITCAQYVYMYCTYVRTYSKRVVLLVQHLLLISKLKCIWGVRVRVLVKHAVWWTGTYHEWHVWMRS